MKNAIRIACLVLVASCLSFAQQQAQLFQGQPPALAGKYIASAYAGWSVHSLNATAAASNSMVLDNCYPKMGQNENIRPIFPFAANVPVTIIDGTNTETVTPSSVTAPTAATNGASTLNAFSCSVTATFVNAHGTGVTIVSGDNGLGEAINDAHATGGVVVLDPGSGITDAQITANTAVFQNVTLEDDRSGAVRYWNPMGGLTTLAAPTTLTAVTALPSATPVGAYGTGTYHMCIAYVDAMGQEGPCSADFSEAGLATGSFIFSAPAASTGAVGYTIYIGLTGGGVTNLNYKVPITSTICTLTTIESTTAACAVTNAPFAQTGSAATVTAITVNTSPIQPAVTIVSTTAVYVPNAGGRTTAFYAPGSHVGYIGVPGAFLPFTISAADATVVPSVIGTVNLPPGFMNIVGRTIEVCGKATTTASTATIKDIQFQWDAFGQNTAGKGVAIGDLSVTQTSTSVTELTFCEDFQTTVAGAGATAGSINTIGGYITAGVAALTAGGAGSETFIGATGSLNLAAEARLNVIYVHTTGTDGAAITLQSLTLKVLN